MVAGRGRLQGSTWRVSGRCGKRDVPRGEMVVLSDWRPLGGGGGALRD